jgi:hypothetical protein
MSTVMRPVGPLPPRVYWIRRSVVLGVILIIILLLATQCGGGGGGGGGRNNGSGNTPNPTTSTSPPTSVTNCDPAVLKVTVSTDTTTYTTGQAPTLTATLANPGTTTCRLARVVSNEVWTIKSGSPTVWTTQGCSADPVPPQLKIAAGATKQIHTTWNGHLRGADCTDAAVAQPGTYRLYATIDGVKAANPAIFHIIT